jgi:predicted nucleic acid-binding protein
VSGLRGLIDTNVFVAARNSREPGHLPSRRLLDRVDAGDLRAIVSTVTIAEVRAGLISSEAGAVWQAFTSHLLSSPHYHVIPVDISVAELAGELRENTNLTLPDALIVAAAKLQHVDFVVTWDHDLARHQSLVSVRTPAEFDR